MQWMQYYYILKKNTLLVTGTLLAEDTRALLSKRGTPKPNCVSPCSRDETTYKHMDTRDTRAQRLGCMFARSNAARIPRGQGATETHSPSKRKLLPTANTLGRTQWLRGHQISTGRHWQLSAHGPGAHHSDAPNETTSASIDAVNHVAKSIGSFEMSLIEYGRNVASSSACL